MAARREACARLAFALRTFWGSRRLQADLALASCSLVWGVTFVVVKDALRDASVLSFLAARFWLATVTLLLVGQLRGKSLNVGSVVGGGVIGVFMFLGYALQTAGLRWTTPARAAFITGSSVVWVPLLERLWRRRPLRRPVWVGACAALTGLYLLTVPRDLPGELNRGDLLVLGCAVAFALHILAVGHYRQRHPVGVLTLVQVATTAMFSLGMLPLAWAAGWERPRLVWTARLVAALVITAVGATAGAFSLQVWAQRFASPTHAAILFSLEPVFAVLTSWLLGAERLTGRILLGGGLVLLGVLLAEVGAHRPLAPESAVSDPA